MKFNELIKYLKNGDKIISTRTVYVIRKDGGTEEHTIVDEYLVSTPPSTHYRVTNLYVDATTSRLVVEYENIPTP